MNRTIPLQRWATIKGRHDDCVVQVSSDWVDAGEATEATFFVQVAALTAHADPVTLVLQSAPSPDVGDACWYTVDTFAAGQPLTAGTYVFATARPSAADPHFSRLLRWKVDGGNSDFDWSATFRICVTLR